MNAIKSIRTRMGLTQAALAEAIGCTQGNVGHYENRGQTMPPDMARKLIQFADSKGLALTFDDIYAEAVDGAGGAGVAVAGLWRVAFVGLGLHRVA